MSPASVITVDGPAGSGKSTLGRAVAERLGLPLIDTGLLYRGVMVAAINAGLDGAEADALARLAERTRIDIGTDPRQPVESLFVEGTDAAAVMRDPTHARLLATISGTPGVRAALLPRQRELARAGAVAVGRDCGTVVFPDAAVKFYLTAPEALRSHRRAAQLSARGARPDSDGLAAEVGERDRADSVRAVSPLRPADDAHVIDTATMGIEEMIAAALDIVAEHGVGIAPG